MEQGELKRHIEFEYWGYYAAERSAAEWNRTPFKPLTLAEFMHRRGIDDEFTARLKPCPFCGGKPKLMTYVSVNCYTSYSVVCKCGVRGPSFHDHAHFAVQGWNKMCRREP